MGQKGKRRLLLGAGGRAAGAPDSGRAGRVEPGVETQTGADSRHKAQGKHHGYTPDHQLVEDCRGVGPPLPTHVALCGAIVDVLVVSLPKVVAH